MKIRFSLLALALTLVAAPITSQAKDEETELGGKMEKMSSAFRSLRRQASKAEKNADSLAKVATIREYAEAALKLEPAKKAELPAAEQAKFVAEYQAKMKEFIGLVDKLEAAFKANNNEEAAKIIRTMGDSQKANHKTFKKDDKDS